MAAPNIASASANVNGKTNILQATNTETDIIASIATGHCARVEAVYATNIHASATGWVTLVLKRGGTSYRVVFQLSIPPNNSVNLLGGRILYLEESDALRIQANASSNIEAVATYEDVS
jgi:hypothetical protein